jgi:hypothetical protein
MKLELGQMVATEGHKYEVIGILSFGSYNEYHLHSPDGADAWLDDCSGGWRLWQKSASTRGSKDVLNLMHWSARDLRGLVGQNDPGFRGALITAIGIEPVLKAAGEVDGVEEGEKVFYVEGMFSGSSKRPLIVAEVWDGEKGDEVEISEGNMVEIAVE